MARRGTWTRRFLGLVACVILVLTGCGDATQPEARNEARVRVALFPGGSTLPAHVAMIKGLFERNGLQVELSEGTDLPLFMAALAD